MLYVVVKKINQLFLTIALLLSASVVHAITVFGEIGLHQGGDDVRTPVTRTASASAGGLFSAALGLLSPVSDSLELRTSIGLKYDFNSSIIFFTSSAPLYFQRYPLEAMLITNNAEGINFGVGASYHFKPVMSHDTNVINAIEFNNALGFVAEVDLKLGRGYVGVKYTSINYKTDNPNIGTLSSNGSFISAHTVNGNSIGLVIGISF